MRVEANWFPEHVSNASQPYVDVGAQLVSITVGILASQLKDRRLQRFKGDWISIRLLDPANQFGGLPRLRVPIRGNEVISAN